MQISDLESQVERMREKLQRYEDNQVIDLDDDDDDDEEDEDDDGGDRSGDESADER